MHAICLCAVSRAQDEFMDEAQLWMLPAERRERGVEAEQKALRLPEPGQASRAGAASWSRTCARNRRPAVPRASSGAPGPGMLACEFESDPRTSARLAGMRTYVTVPEIV